MQILEFFYKSWNVIIIMSTIIGLLAVFVPFNKLIGNEGGSELIKVLKEGVINFVSLNFMP